VALEFSAAGTLTDRNGTPTPVKLATREVCDACFSPDGNVLAIASDFGLAGLWRTEDLAKGGTIAPALTLTGFTLSPHSVGFSPDLKRLVVGGGDDQAVRLWDLVSTQQVLTLRATGYMFRRTRFSPDGNVLAAGDNLEGILYLWRAPTFSETDAAEAG
jgi:WD40 repeat protein